MATSYFQCYRNNGYLQYVENDNWLYCPASLTIYNPASQSQDSVQTCSTGHTRSASYPDYLYCSEDFELITYTAYQALNPSTPPGGSVAEELSETQRSELTGYVFGAFALAFTFSLLRKFISNHL